MIFLIVVGYWQTYQWVFCLVGGCILTIFLAENHFPSFCNCATLAKTVASFLPVTADGEGTTGVVGLEAWSLDDFLEGESGRDTTTGESMSTED